MGIYVRMKIPCGITFPTGIRVVRRYSHLYQEQGYLADKVDPTFLGCFCPMRAESYKLFDQRLGKAVLAVII